MENDTRGTKRTRTGRHAPGILCSLIVGDITTVAGNGSAGYESDGGFATVTKTNRPYGVAVDSAGNVYLADTENHWIRMIDMPAMSMRITSWQEVAPEP